MSSGAFGSAYFTVTTMALCLMAAAYPVYRVVALWFDRALSTAETTIYLSVLIFLIIGIMATLGSPLGFLLIIVFLGLCLGVPLMNAIADRVTLRRLEEADILEFRMTLSRQPGNLYARERLARIYQRRRMYDEALAEIKAALNTSPKDPNFTLLQQRFETERRRAITHAKVCPKCYVENPPEAAACLDCGFRFVDPGDFLRMLLGDTGQQALRWGGLGFGGLGLLLLVAGAAPALAGLLFVSGIGCMVLYLYARLAMR